MVSSFCFTSGTHTICSDEPCHDGERKTFEVMLTTLLLGTIAATLYQGNRQWYDTQSLEYRINWKMYTPYAGAVGKIRMGK
jgi:hypothetical protein